MHLKFIDLTNTDTMYGYQLYQSEPLVRQNGNWGITDNEQKNSAYIQLSVVNSEL